MTVSLTLPERLSAMNAALDAGIICSRRFEATVDGVEQVCLLLALAPEATVRGGFHEDNPSRVCVAASAIGIPEWFGHLTVVIDDAASASDGDWYARVSYYAEVVSFVLPRMTKELWDDAHRRLLAFLHRDGCESETLPPQSMAGVVALRYLRLYSANGSAAAEEFLIDLLDAFAGS